MNHKTTTALGAAVAVLIVAVCGLGYYAFDLRQQLEEERPASVHRSTEGWPFSPAARGSFSSHDDFNGLFTEMQNVRREMNRMFEDAFSGFDRSLDFGTLLPESGISPRLELEEHSDRYELEVPIPEGTGSNVDVSIEGRRLHIAGSIHEEKEQSGVGNLHRRERRSRRFEQVLPLPADADGERMRQEHADGTLKLIIPKVGAVG